MRPSAGRTTAVGKQVIGALEKIDGGGRQVMRGGKMKNGDEAGRQTSESDFSQRNPEFQSRW